jgi:hypothetical protein
MTYVVSGFMTYVVSGFSRTVIVVTIAAVLAIASSASAQTTRGCNLPPQFPCPDARIMSFDADRTSITPGEPVVLSWVAENPGAMSVTPGVGPVIARGSARVTPAATTTYTLSVGGGPNGQVLTKAITITVAGSAFAPSATAGAARSLGGGGTTQDVLRMPDGKPNLQGVFSPFGARGVGPGRGGAAPAANALPRTPTLKKGMESYRVVYDDKAIISDCVVGSVPPSFGPYSFQIIQTPQYVVLFYEYMHLFRIVPIDVGVHQSGESWMGDSIGRWDGDTFVIDTVGFNLKSTVGGTGDRHQPFRHSEQLHMIERIRRIDLNTIEIDTRLEDPKVFEGPWGSVGRYTYHPEFTRVEEYMCAENAKDYDFLLDPKKGIKLP